MTCFPKTNSNLQVTWLDVTQKEERYANLYASHREWVDRVQNELKRSVERPGLLQLVVRWGRMDMAERVLSDAALLEQRLPMQVHLPLSVRSSFTSIVQKLRRVH